MINLEKMEILQQLKLTKNKRVVELEKSLIIQLTRRIILAFTTIQLMNRIAKKIIVKLIRVGWMIVSVRII